MVLIIDLARARRIRYENRRNERELATVDFDVFGHPIALRPDIEAEIEEERALLRRQARPVDYRKIVGEQVADDLIRFDPTLARRLGLFPPLRLVEADDGDEDEG